MNGITLFLILAIVAALLWWWLRRQRDRPQAPGEIPASSSAVDLTPTVVTLPETSGRVDQPSAPGPVRALAAVLD